MTKSFKTEIKPTREQKQKILQTIGVCRFLYNKYIYINQQIYTAMKHLGLHKRLKSFMDGYEFNKWVNNYLSRQEGFEWIKDVSSKARKRAIMNAETAYKRFFGGQSKFPRYKKRRQQNVKIYFPKNNIGDFTIERHRIKIPTLKFVRLKEKGYIPVNSLVSSGTISMKANRFYVSIMVDITTGKSVNKSNTDGLGIDLGIKEFAVISDGRRFKNINKSFKVRKLEKKFKREQRRLSRKYEFKRKRGDRPGNKNIEKQVLRVQKLHCRLSNIRLDYIRKTAHSLAKTKPEYITIEDLNVRGIMKNRHLSKAISKQNFNKFTKILKSKCQQYDVPLRVVNRFYPSSKTCNVCGNVKKDLKLSDRTYHCDICGYEIDRDLGAAINLAMAKEYTLIT